MNESGVLGVVGSLTLATGRSGSVAEFALFLGNLENAYVALYGFLLEERPLRHARRRLPPEFWHWGPAFQVLIDSPDAILPDHRLQLVRAQFSSPGMLEVVGSLNPLEQMRRYLNDRHERTKDSGYRNAAEAERLRLENEILQREIWRKDDELFRERIDVLRELGFSAGEIRQLVWARLGRQMSALGAHQDSGLIVTASTDSMSSGSRTSEQ